MTLKLSSEFKPSTPSWRNVRRGLSRPATVVLVVLIGLTVTAGMLWALSPIPLSPDSILNLSAATDLRGGTGTGSADQVDSMADQIFQDVTVAPQRWTRIAVRLSGTSSGNAATLAEMTATRGNGGPPDHFVICNGIGGGDGEIQVTSLWQRQRSAFASGFAADDRTLSIALVADTGDGGSPSPPTAAQMARLTQLLSALQGRLAIGPDGVIVPPRS